MKESGPDISRIAQLVDQTPSGFSLPVGSALTFFPSLCVGAVGGVLALACVVPDLCTRLYALVQERRFEDGEDVTGAAGAPGAGDHIDPWSTGAKSRARSGGVCRGRPATTAAACPA